MDVPMRNPVSRILSNAVGGVVMALLLTQAVFMVGVYLWIWGVPNSLVDGGGNRVYATPFVWLVSLPIAVAYSYRVSRMKAGQGRAYLYGVVVLIIVVAISVLLLFGGACAVCRAFVCSEVQSCGVSMGWLEAEVSCYCK